ncbi:MAG TPA: glycosyltransferase family A protein [Chthoniobacterales bacterium]
MPLFSVIIPTYNRKHFLRRALRSVMRQSCQDFEVIVVDDGSTDGTEAMVAGFPRVVYLRQQNRGPGAARNLGWERATGDYLAFLDSDDLWFPWTLATFARCLKAHHRPAFVSGHYFPFYDEKRVREVKEEAFDSKYYRDYFASASAHTWVGAGGMLVRCDCRARFPTSLHVAEDLYLIMQLGIEDGFVSIQNPCTFAYRYHGNNAIVDAERTFSGLRELVRAEKAGKFPGGRHRGRERRMLLARPARQVGLRAVEQAQYRKAARIYLETFWWQVESGRWRFLLGLPALAIAGLPRAFRHAWRNEPATTYSNPENFATLEVTPQEAARRAGIMSADSDEP